MGRTIEIIVDPVQDQAIRNLLGALNKRTPSLIRNAVNITARKARKELPVRAQERYVIKAPKMKKNISLSSASLSKLEAVIRVKGKPLQLIYFHTKKNTKRGAAKARGRNDRSLQEMISSQGGKAFIVSIDNGTDENGQKKKGHKAIVQRVGKDRYPIITFAGPSAPEMLGNRSVYVRMAPKIRRDLMQNIRKQIDRLKGGRR